MKQASLLIKTHSDIGKMCTILTLSDIEIALKQTSGELVCVGVIALLSND